MHFQSAGFAQAVLFHEHPDVVICGEDPTRNGIKRVFFAGDCFSVAIQEGYGQVVPGTIPDVLKTIGIVKRHVLPEYLRLPFFEFLERGPWVQLYQGERCLRPMPAWYPEVDYHADEGNECGHPCRRGPREASHPMHNSIFPQKKNAAGTSCGNDKESR